MSTIHFHQTTTSTPEQFAGLTDFGPGRSKVFAKSADSYLKLHHQPTSRVIMLACRRNRSRYRLQRRSTR